MNSNVRGVHRGSRLSSPTLIAHARTLTHSRRVSDATAHAHTHAQGGRALATSYGRARVGVRRVMHTHVCVCKRTSCPTGLRAPRVPCWRRRRWGPARKRHSRHSARRACRPARASSARTPKGGGERQPPVQAYAVEGACVGALMLRHAHAHAETRCHSAHRLAPKNARTSRPDTHAHGRAHANTRARSCVPTARQGARRVALVSVRKRGFTLSDCFARLHANHGW